MLKELRELVSFVLNFVNDIFEFVRTSQLSASPIVSLGRDRALALQLSGVVGIVLTGIFIHALRAVPANVDLLPFGTITLVYFTVVAFLIGLLVRNLGPKPTDNSLTAVQKNQNANDRQVDATSYVICFNLVALLIFAVLRSVLYFTAGVSSVMPAVIISAISAAILLLAFGRRSPTSSFSVIQKAFVVIILMASFVAYAMAISGPASLA